MSTISGDISFTKMISTAILLTITLTVIRAVYLLYLHPLSHIPGPRLWVLSRFPYALSLRKGHLAVRLKELHVEYGPLVRIASNEVSIIHQEAWNDIFSYQTNFPKNPIWYQHRPKTVGTGIIAVPVSEHSRYRRTFAPAFTEKAVREQEPLILRHIDNMIVELKKEVAVNDGSPTDFLKWLEYITFDIIGDLCFSESFDCVVSSENRGQIYLLQAGMKAIVYTFISRLYGMEMAWRWVSSKVSTLGPKTKTKYYKSVHSLTQKRIDEGDTIEKNDLMTFVCRRTDGKGLSISEAENSLGDFMVAGSETVATTLAALFYHLSRDSQAAQKLIEELQRHFDNESSITGKELSELPFLNAVINEAMRLGPSLPTAMPRIVPESGANVCGHWFPPNSILTFNQLAANYSPANFESPEKFIPSRWLPESILKTHNTEVFRPFSFGPRNCIGKDFAMLELRLMVAKLMWNFDMSPQGDNWEWISQNAYLIWEKKRLHMKITIRS